MFPVKRSFLRMFRSMLREAGKLSGINIYLATDREGFITVFYDDGLGRIFMRLPCFL